MKRLRRGLHPLALAAAGAFVLFCAAAPAFAQEEGASPADTTVGWVFRWLNFALVFGGIAYALVKYAAPAFRRRTGAIVAAIGEAARVKQEAEERRREAEAKLAGLEQEITRLRAEAQRDAAAEAERLRQLAREEAQKIERAAKAEIFAAERAARLELKAVGARLAVERAEALLRQNINAASEATLFRSFVQDLERSAN
jgi:F-type H+-transporting ATPase subunit b